MTRELTLADVCTFVRKRLQRIKLQPATIVVYTQRGDTVKVVQARVVGGLFIHYEQHQHVLSHPSGLLMTRGKLDEVCQAVAALLLLQADWRESIDWENMPASERCRKAVELIEHVWPRRRVPWMGTHFGQAARRAVNDPAAVITAHPDWPKPEFLDLLGQRLDKSAKASYNQAPCGT